MNSVTKKHQSIINVIAYCIENDEQGIKNILQRNGVDTSTIKTKNALRTAFIDALGKSKSLAVDFLKYIEVKKKSSSSLNFDGYDFGEPLNLDDFKLDTNTTQFNAPTKSPLTIGSNLEDRPLLSPSLSTTTFSPSKSSGGFFSGLNLQDLINTGVGVLEIQRDIQVSKDNKEAIKNAVQIKQNEINLQPKSSTSSVGMYLIGALVVLTFIGGLFYFVKKRKK